MDDFELLKRQSFLQVLFKSARLANEAALVRLRDKSGQSWLRPAHANLFPHIPFDGIRLSEIADRLGITKQAIQSLVDDFVEAGMVERIPDPSDGRAKLIRWTDLGRRSLEEGVAFLNEFNDEFAALVSVEALDAAHATLLAIADHLEPPEG